MTRPELHPTLTRYFDSIRRMDWPAVAACFTADALQEDPVGGGTRRGPAEIQGFFVQIGALFATVELVPTKVFVCGNEIAVVWDGKAHAKNGADVTFEGIDVVVLDGAGKITSLRAFWDAGPVIAKASAPA
jgi:steroid delta-isomerase